MDSRPIELTGVAIAEGAALFMTRYPEIPALNDAPRLDRALIKRGADLAALRDCNTCHTAEGGKTFAGGRDIPTQHAYHVHRLGNLSDLAL